MRISTFCSRSTLRKIHRARDVWYAVVTTVIRFQSCFRAYSTIFWASCLVLVFNPGKHGDRLAGHPKANQVLNRGTGLVVRCVLVGRGGSKKHPRCDPTVVQAGSMLGAVSKSTDQHHDRVRLPGVVNPEEPSEPGQDGPMKRHDEPDNRHHQRKPDHPVTPPSPRWIGCLGNQGSSHQAVGDRSNRFDGEIHLLIVRPEATNLNPGVQVYDCQHCLKFGLHPPGRNANRRPCLSTRSRAGTANHIALREPRYASRSIIASVATLRAAVPWRLCGNYPHWPRLSRSAIRSPFSRWAIWRGPRDVSDRI